MPVFAVRLGPSSGQGPHIETGGADMNGLDIHVPGARGAAHAESDQTGRGQTEKKFRMLCLGAELDV